MQRAHPAQGLGPCGARAPAHRLRPREIAQHGGQDFSQKVERRAAGLFDDGDVEFALFGVRLDGRLIERGKPRAFQKALHRSVWRTNARAFLLLAQVGLPRWQACNVESKAPRRRKGSRALIGETAIHKRLRDKFLQILRRLHLHARRDFLGENFEQKIGHQFLLPEMISMMSRAIKSLGFEVPGTSLNMSSRMRTSTLAFAAG